MLAACLVVRVLLDLTQWYGTESLATARLAGRLSAYRKTRAISLRRPRAARTGPICGNTAAVGAALSCRQSGVLRHLT